MVIARLALVVALALLPGLAAAQEVKLGSQFNTANQSGAVAPTSTAILGGACADGSACTIPVYGFGGTPALAAYRAGGTNIAKAALAAGDMVGSYDFYGWNGTAYVFGGRFSCSASAAWTGSVNTLGCQISANTSGSVTTGNTFSIVGVDGAAANFGAFSFGGASNMVGTRANGTAAAPTGLASGDTLGSIGFRGNTGSGTSTAINGFSCTSSETWSSAANGAICKFNYTPAGTTAAKVALGIGDAVALTVPSRLTSAIVAGAGTDLSSATPVTAELNFVNTVASGSGVSLPAYSTALASNTVEPVRIFNGSTSTALAVYPPSASAQIRSGTTTAAAGASVSLAPGGWATFWCYSVTLCVQGP